MSINKRKNAKGKNGNRGAQEVACEAKAES
jgi:hypothetical protein